MQPKVVISSIDGCKCVHVASEPVHEIIQGQTAWPGTVEVFDVIGHPKAKRVYACQYEDDEGQSRTVTVLEIPPVDSAQTAVKMAIAAKARQKRVRVAPKLPRLLQTINFDQCNAGGVVLAAHNCGVRAGCERLDDRRFCVVRRCESG